MPKSSVTLSIVIPTQLHTTVLSRCITSIAKQMEMPDELLLITHVSCTPETITKQLYALDVPCRIIHITHNNVSHARNIGLKNASGALVGFIDDDCVMSKDWTKQMKQSFQKHDSTSAIQGKSIEKPTTYWHTVFSEIHQLISPTIQKLHASDRSYFDTKNVVVSKKIFSKTHMQFDEMLPYQFEDVDLGMRLLLSENTIIRNEKATVTHHPTIQARTFIYKLFIRGQAWRLFTQKWRHYFQKQQKLQRLFRQSPRAYSYLSSLTQYTKLSLNTLIKKVAQTYAKRGIRIGTGVGFGLCILGIGYMSASRKKQHI